MHAKLRRDARGVRSRERDVAFGALGQLRLLRRRGVPHVHRGVSAPNLNGKKKKKKAAATQQQQQQRESKRNKRIAVEDLVGRLKI